MLYNNDESFLQFSPFYINQLFELQSLSQIHMWSEFPSKVDFLMNELSY